MKVIKNCISDMCFNPLTLFQPSLVFVRTLSPLPCAKPLAVVSTLPIQRHFLVRTLSPVDNSLVTAIRNMAADLLSLRERAGDDRFLDKTRYLSSEDDGDRWVENLQP